MRGQSLFSYPLTKRYPFPWFTPVAAVLGIVFAVLFSLLNLAADGYCEFVSGRVVSS
jgi:hypothetical protein